MRVCVASLFACFSFFALSSCATIFNGWKDVEIPISSDPKGGELYWDDKLQECKTPCTIKASKSSRHFIRVEKSGYEPGTTIVKRRVSVWFWISVGISPLGLPGLLLGGAFVLTDWLTGSMWRFQHKDYHLVLKKDEDAPEPEPDREEPPPKPELNLDAWQRRVREVYPEEVVKEQITLYYGTREEEERDEILQRLYDLLVSQLKDGQRLDLDQAVKNDMYQRELPYHKRD